VKPPEAGARRPWSCPQKDDPVEVVGVVGGAGARRAADGLINAGGIADDGCSPLGVVEEAAAKLSEALAIGPRGKGVGGLVG